MAQRRERFLMTPERKEWNAFVEKMEGPRGLNFRPTKHDGIVWNCGGGFKVAERVLEAMGAQVEESLAYFRANGAPECDCEILFNVERGLREVRHGERRRSAGPFYGEGRVGKEPAR